MSNVKQALNIIQLEDTMRSVMGKEIEVAIYLYSEQLPAKIEPLKRVLLERRKICIDYFRLNHTEESQSLLREMFVRYNQNISQVLGIITSVE